MKSTLQKLYSILHIFRSEKDVIPTHVIRAYKGVTSFLINFSSFTSDMSEWNSKLDFLQANFFMISERN